MAERTTTQREPADAKIIASLRTIGLTTSEAKLYVAAIQQGQTTISVLATATGINRRNVYDSVSTLITKGLLSQIVGERDNTYAAVDPAKLMELTQTKELALESIIPSLEERFATPTPGEQAIIYKGIEGFHRYLEDILVTKQDVYCLGAKGGWGTTSLGDFADWFEQERIRQRIKVYNLFDHEMRPLLAKQTRLYDTLAEQRFLPKEFSTDSAVDVFGDRVVTFTGLQPEKVADNVTLFVLTNRDLADSFRIWFQLMWENSSK